MPDALAAAYDVLLLDLDGVVYIGGTAIPGAPEALQRASAARRPAGLRHQQRLAHARRRRRDPDRHGRPCSAEPTSSRPPRPPPGCWPRSYRPKAKVLVLGALALRLAVRERGLIPVSNAAEHPQAVVQGYSPGIGYGSLAEGGLAVRAGALFVGTNADSTIPSARGTAPGNGSLLQVIEHATGVQPQIAGKPEPPLHRESVIRTGAKRAAGDRRPPRHRHRGRLQRRRRQPAGPHRRRQSPQRRARPAAPPPHLHRREPRRPAPALSGRHPHRRRRHLRRLDRNRRRRPATAA